MDRMRAVNIVFTLKKSKISKKLVGLDVSGKIPTLKGSLDLLFLHISGNFCGILRVFAQLDPE